MKRMALVLGFGLVAFAAGCKEQALPKAQPPAKPATPPPPAAQVVPATDAARPPDDSGRKLTQMEIKWEETKRKRAEEAALAKQLAGEELARLRTFDKSKLPKHLALFAFEKKTRKQLEDTAAKLKGKPDAVAQIEKLKASLRRGIEAQAKVLRAMDPQGGNSNISTDHDVGLNILANDYPDAIAASFNGDDKPLADARAEMDKREKKISSWLDEVKKAKK